MEGRGRGASLGLRADTSRSHIVQAVLEGVAFAARDNLAALAAAGTHLSEVDLVGGGSRSPLWTQIVADVLGLPVHRGGEGEGAAALRPPRPGPFATTCYSPAVACTRPL